MEELTNEQLVELKKTFSKFDQDGDCTISTKELGKVMKELNQQPTNAELQDMINEVDADGNGTIDWPEFLSLMKKKMHDTKIEQELSEAFVFFDRTKANKLSTNDFKIVMQEINIDITDEEIEQMVKDSDIDEDGYINLQEFMRMMMGK